MHWMPLAVAIVGVFSFMYLGLQQSYRINLNDPQVELVENLQHALLFGKQPQELVMRTDRFDASESLSPFVAVYDESGNPLEWSATIHGEPPRPPEGVFQYAKQKGEHRVSWQPTADTRIALVIRPVALESGWFVAAGRNMREVEERERILGYVMGTGMFFTLFVTFVLEFAGDWVRRFSLG